MLDVEQAKAYKDQGNQLFKQGNYADAIESYTKAIECCSNDEVLYSNRSGSYASLGNYNEALNDANKCLQLNPSFSKGYLRKGYALLKMNRIKEAQETYNAGLSMDPNNDQLKNGLNECNNQNKPNFDANMMMRMLQMAKDNPKIKQYIQEDPQYLEKLMNAVSGLSSNPQAALNLLSTGDTKIRDGLMAILSMGMGGQDMNAPTYDSNVFNPTKSEQVESSENKSNNIPAKTPESEPSLTADQKLKEEGNALYKQKKFDEALQCYEKAYDNNPNELLYLNNQAAVYMEKNDLEKALDVCNRAIDNHLDVQAPFSTVAKIYKRIATIYMKKEEYEVAIKNLNLSLAEENSRQTRNLLRECKQLLEKKKANDYIDIDKAEKLREEGNELFKKGEYPEAKKIYDEAIKRNPNDHRLYGNRAACYMKLLEMPMALTDANKAIDICPDIPKAWGRKGTIHTALKDYNNAMTAFDRGLAIDSTNIDCINGKNQLLMKIQQSQSSGQVDEEQVRNAMSDPEIQSILSDPQFQMVLKNLTENPQSINSYMNDPKIANGIQKLVNSGIIRTS